MTDHKLVLELCKRLNLTRLDNEDHITDGHHCSSTDYYAGDTRVCMSHGVGYLRFYVEFNFTSDGKLINHGVFE